MTVPHTVFIIPYRNRPVEKAGLDSFLNKLRIDRKWGDDMNVIYVNQKDSKKFNRGAMKNIGFIYLKNTYPENYKNITMIFHDVDFYPITTDLLNYSTNIGTVEHYYGYTHVLGGIFAIKGADFEKTGGFPNFWGWGFEDNVMYYRCINDKNNISVDRSCFYKINDKHIIYINEDGDKYIGDKVVSNREITMYYREDLETFNDIKNLEYSKQGDMLNINNFETRRMYHDEEFEERDLNITGGLVIPKSGYWRRNWNFNSIKSTKKEKSLKNNSKYNNKNNDNVKKNQKRTWKLF